jgi:uncharacterized DUF497 family protein
LTVIFNDEDHSVAERREIIVGHSLLNRLVLVCFKELGRGRVRIFSSRVPTKKERKDYENREDF